MTDGLLSLARVPLLAHLDDARLQELADRSVLRTVDAGSVVAGFGQRADRLVVVESGVLTAIRELADGRRMRFGDFAAPCAVDKAAVLDAAGHTATWVAAARSRVRLVPRDELLTLIDDVSAVRRHVLTHLATEVRVRRDAAVSARFADTTTRVIGWLLDAAAGGGTRVVLPGAQEGLGEEIGASRVSVNRALRKLVALGLVRTEPGAVTLLAPELLARYTPDRYTSDPVERGVGR